MPIRVRELIRLLEQNGWARIRTNGDHRIYRHPDGRITVISGHLGDDVRPGTLKAVLRQTGIKEPNQRDS